MAEHICKVCGTTYPGNRKRCPKCGCPNGDSVPAYLRCKRCGTVMTSRKKTCPGCGQPISPATATVVLLPPDAEKTTRRRIVIWCTVTLTVLIICIGEFFIVKQLYAGYAYRHSLELWNTPGSIDANRKTPDPVYNEPTVTDVPDSLIDTLINARNDIPEEERHERDAATETGEPQDTLMYQ